MLLDNFRILRITLGMLCGLGIFSQAAAQEKDGFYSVGYQYANFGNSLASNQVRMAGANLAVEPGGDRFTNYQHGYGLVLRATLPGTKNFHMEFTLANKKVISDQTYNLYNADSTTVTPIDVKVKTRVRTLSYGGSYFLGNFSFGGSVDMGMFASLQRVKGYPDSDNEGWQPWFYRQKIFGSGISGKTPIIGFSLFASYRIAKTIQIRIYKQYTAFGMGASLSDNFFSIANSGVELALTFPNK